MSQDLNIHSHNFDDHKCIQKYPITSNDNFDELDIIANQESLFLISNYKDYVYLCNDKIKELILFRVNQGRVTLKSSKETLDI